MHLIFFLNHFKDLIKTNIKLVTNSIPVDQSLQAFNQTSLLRKYESEIESLKKCILFIFLNKGILLTILIVLLFVFYVIIKRYVKKK
jgi:hypothetical protein